MLFLKKYLLRNDDAGADGGGGSSVADKGAPTPDGGQPAGSEKPVDDKGAAGDKGADVKPGDKGSDKPGDKDGYWPADWRENISKGDTKLQQRLGRYQSPQALAEALIAAQNKISSGELKPVLGKNPTPEQLKEFRDANGIPEEPTKYDLKDVKTDLLTPEHVDIILKNAHSANQTPEQVKASITAATSIVQSIKEQQTEKDATDKVTNEDALRSEWGGEFRKNINLIQGLLDGQADEKLKGDFLRARMPDGTMLGNHPSFMRMALQLALINNPTGTVVPGAGGDVDKGLREELGKIQDTMKNSRAAYNKDDKMQARYRELTDAAISRGLMDSNGVWKK